MTKRRRNPNGSSRPAPLQQPDPPPRDDEQTDIATVRESGSFTGPLPPPAMLERYNRAFPGCAERIVAMAEQQSHHRQQLESSHLASTQRNERLGQFFAFVLGLAGILGGIGLIATEKEAAGLTSFISALVALLGVFIFGRQSQQRERARKRAEFREKQLPLPYRQEE